MDERTLSGQVALVTGASRGIGRGVAFELGVHGATVYLTGRTTSADAPDRTDTIDHAAAEIIDAGGTAIALRCDHRVDDEVRAVIDRIDEEQGRLDVLVNNASGNMDSDTRGRRFWEFSLSAWDDLVDVGLRSNFVTTALAIPLMLRRGSGLVANISSPGSVHYLVSVPYGAAKAGTDKMTRDMALELREHRVAVISLWPGVVKTDRMISRATRGEKNRIFIQGFDLSGAETPRFSGRAVVALATDPDLMAKTGRAFPCFDLAREYGFTDVDGNMPAFVSDLDALMAADDVPEFWKAIVPFGVEGRQ